MGFTIFSANLAFGLATISALVAIIGGFSTRMRPFLVEWIFIAGVVTTIFASWLPSILAAHELGNPDESQIIAGTLTLLQDPVPWRSADMSTTGPLNAVPLWVAGKAGLELNFALARIIAALMT